MADRGKVQIRVIHTSNNVAVLKAFRKVTDATISTIRDAITQRSAMDAAQLYGRDHANVANGLLALLNNLDDMDTEYELIIDGKPESRQYLENILQRWRDSGIEAQMMTNLEIGEPDLATLEWLQRNAPVDVFRDTLLRVVHSDGYNVDGETLAWVKRQLGIA